MSAEQISAARTTSRYQVGLFALLCCFLAAPLLVTGVEAFRGPTAKTSDACSAAPRWGTTWREARKYPGKLRYYLGESCFGLKGSLAHLHGWISVRLLDTSSTPMVLLGENGWLFGAFDHVLDYQRAAEPLDDARLREWIDALEQRRASLAARRIAYAFVVAPDTHSIYPEHLPRALARGAPTRLDQLVEAARKQAPELLLIDLRPALRELKNEAPLYFKTDTHWNPVAGWLASRVVTARLHLLPQPGDLTPLRVRRIAGGDLARLLGMPTSYEDEEAWPAATPAPSMTDEAGKPLSYRFTNVVFRERVRVLNPAGRKKALVFQDSFAEAMIPWLSGAFRETLWVRSYRYSDELVTREAPDVVIEQVVERKLMSLASPGGGLKDDPFLQPAAQE